MMAAMKNSHFGTKIMRAEFNLKILIFQRCPRSSKFNIGFHIRAIFNFAFKNPENNLVRKLILHNLLVIG